MNERRTIIECFECALLGRPCSIPPGEFPRGRTLQTMGEEMDEGMELKKKVVTAIGERLKSRPMAVRTKGSGRRTQTFFMVKSNDVGTIWNSNKDSIWATSSVEKGDVLANAFENSKNVVLFFSTNKLGAS
ncbi:hypothetical protein PG999_008494 [Apiospora kogelbergensis]|uniref:YTH domain-containing protein n=1 Tax=Apiospora kogelbergensis TaxID=1337665 RepID=A0AAW0QUF8_9PEZI